MPVSGHAPDDFAQYLDGPVDQPLGVAVSGGGDSLALLYALRQWGQRPLHVFCVDHGLNPLSASWSRTVAGHANTVGARFTALTWQGDKPLTGVSAKARAARHALLADAARDAGVAVLCLAHTRDDLAEAEAMRSEDSNVTAPAVWGPSPVWPQGRGVCLYRPFLNLRRETLRDFLRDQGVAWIDDPANENHASSRIRARHTLSSKDLQPVFMEPPERLDLSGLLLDAGSLGTLGMIVLSAPKFHALPFATASKVLAAALVCAGGGDRLPRGDSLDQLIARLSSGAAMTLCGARVQQTAERIEIVREAGDIRRAGRDRLTLTSGITRMWDGRFAITATEPGEIYPVAGMAAQLDDGGKAVLARLPSRLRAVLPVFQNGPGLQNNILAKKNWEKKLLRPHAPLTQAAYDGMECTGWVLPRFLMATGQVRRESDLRHMACISL